MRNLVIVLIALFVVGGGVFVWFTLQKRSDANSTMVNPVVAAIPSQAQVQTTTAPAPSPKLAVLTEIPLTVAVPADGAKLSTTQVTVAGTTAANAEVSVNESTTTADANGNFSLPITLEEGENYLAVLAVDGNGLAAEKQISVSVSTFQQ